MQMHETINKIMKQNNEQNNENQQMNRRFVWEIGIEEAFYDT